VTKRFETQIDCETKLKLSSICLTPFNLETQANGANLFSTALLVFTGGGYSSISKKYNRS
jgi:hypothetical protein